MLKKGSAAGCDGTVRAVVNLCGAGHWVGVKLEEPKGKNDGHFKLSGKRHFCCKPDHGLYLHAGQAPDQPLVNTDYWHCMPVTSRLVDV